MDTDKIWDASFASNLAINKEGGLAAEIAAKSLISIIRYADSELETSRELVGKRVVAIMQEVMENGLSRF